MKNILFIEAHPDDIVISIGATLLKLLDEGKRIIWITLSKPSNERDIEHIKIIDKLPNVIYHNLNHQDGHVKCDNDTIRILDDIVKLYDIDTIFTHWKYSSHQDHQNAYKLSIIIARKTIQNIYMYESVAPSNVTFPTFVANKYFNVDNYLFAKMRMLKNYESQVKKYGLGWVKAIEGLAKFRGYIANCTYAESVQVIKEVDN